MSGTPSEFESRIRAALKTFEQMYEEALRTGAQLPRLSLSNFMKTSRISRAALYQNHESLLKDVQDLLERLAETRPKPTKTLSIKSLQRELTLVRASAKEALATAHAAQMNDLIHRLGPAMRDATQLMIECQQHLRTIDTLKKRIANQNDVILRLRQELLSRPHEAT